MGSKNSPTELKRWVNQAVRLQASSFSVAKAEAPNPSRWLCRWFDVTRFSSGKTWCISIISATRQIPDGSAPNGNWTDSGSLDTHFWHVKTIQSILGSNYWPSSVDSCWFMLIHSPCHVFYLISAISAPHFSMANSDCCTSSVLKTNLHSYLK